MLRGLAVGGFSACFVVAMFWAVLALSAGDPLGEGDRLMRRGQPWLAGCFAFYVIARIVA